MNLIEFVKERVPLISTMFSIADKELIKDAIKITKQAQNALEDENTGKEASNIKKETTSDSGQSNKSKKSRPQREKRKI
ncbi:hypothetical protein IMZ28_00665 [Sulfurovum indicum]|uniref:Uncharacterized protein n=1 Tax=Sulfurovum indicum TaxID=2779528 RepID=A0A7M1S4M1_9BACT|nr:hypothetical protein [Sulfurovum indicum]QOR62032.1 hypothetical protein IMZ28_00665 [Sulfurovum indicum]